MIKLQLIGQIGPDQNTEANIISEIQDETSETNVIMSALKFTGYALKEFLNDNNQDLLIDYLRRQPSASDNMFATGFVFNLLDPVTGKILKSSDIYYAYDGDYDLPETWTNERLVVQDYQHSFKILEH